MDSKGRPSRDGRNIAGYASVFGPPPDAVKDIVETFAYNASLAVRPTIPVLAYHDSTKAIGKTRILAADQIGLLFASRLSDTLTADEILVLVGDGVLSQMSIGYDVKASRRGRYGGEPVRYLSEIALWEISVVLFGACDRTTVSLSKTSRAIADAVVVAEYDRMRRERPGRQPTREETLEYAKSMRRMVERDLYDGLTAREYLRKAAFAVQEELKSLRREMK